MTVAILAQAVGHPHSVVLVMTIPVRERIARMIGDFKPCCVVYGKGNEEVFVRAIGCEFLKFMKDLLSIDLKHNQYMRCVTN